MKYIIIENEQLYKKTDFTYDDACQLIAFEKTINKWFDKMKLNYQLELSKWTYRGQEEKLYRSIETIEEMRKSLSNLDNLIKDNKKLD